jgi:hypothetical protein
MIEAVLAVLVVMPKVVAGVPVIEKLTTPPVWRVNPFSVSVCVAAADSLIVEAPGAMVVPLAKACVTEPVLV